ncbi:transcriptional regulator [Aureimonas sp. SA4125]|uniref:GntR family transcriptional regulator n=1 Tax=Aureimonas sp. SA4125 TaxID=2826993 RepID=UPI001E6CE9D8|nr:GntR family transcriptional regulator [Aureimonas sp. SA4125]BDA84187.1 transcriptional regulator [Aureimonas sp. SA4125]
MPPVVKRTQTDLIREAIADRIVQGYFRPGEALDETVLAAEFGVSRTPIREALRQLEAYGLAQSRPHRGTIVASMCDTQLDEVFFVMAELEALCARLCAENLLGREADALAILHEAGAAHVAANAVEAFRTHNERFHNAIYAGAGNAFLEESTVAVRRRLAPFRKVQFDAFHRIAESQREHGLVVAAILRGDGEAAAEAMRAHLGKVRRTVDRVTDYVAPRELAPERPAETRARMPPA